MYLKKYLICIVYQVRKLFSKKVYFIHIHVAELRGIIIDQHFISKWVLNKKGHGHIREIKDHNY